MVHVRFARAVLGALYWLAAHSLFPLNLKRRQNFSCLGTSRLSSAGLPKSAASWPASGPWHRSRTASRSRSIRSPHFFQRGPQAPSGSLTS